MNLKKIIYLLVFVSAPLLASSSGQISYCDALWANRLDPSSVISRSTIVIVASNQYLKSMNDLLGQSASDAQVKTEHLTLLLHAAFQKHMMNATQELEGLSLNSRQADHVKTVEFSFEHNNPEALYKIIDQSKRQAVSDIVNYVFSSGHAQANKVLKDIQSQKNFILPEGLREVEPLSSDLYKDMQSRIASEFSSRNALESVLLKNYGIGVARETKDAVFSSKLSTILYGIEQKTFHVFNIALYRKHLENALQKKRGVAKIFAGASEEQVLAIFKVIRANYNKSEGWSSDYIEILKKYGGASKVARAHVEVSEFIKMMNLFDYIPPESFLDDPVARTKFNSFKSPTGLLHLDIIKLGAHNYARIYSQLEVFYNAVKSLDQLNEKLVSQQNASNINFTIIDSLQKALVSQLASFKNMQESILQPTGEFLSAVKNEAHAKLEALGLKRDQDYVFWASGDDIYIAFRSKSLTSLKVGHALNKSSVLKDNTRIIVGDHSSGADLLLTARDMFGEAVEFAKDAELLGLEDTHIVSVGGDGNPLGVYPDGRLFDQGVTSRMEAARNRK